VSATPQELVSQYHIRPRFILIHVHYHVHHVWHVLHSTKLMKYRCSTCWFVQSLNYLTSRHAGRRRRWSAPSPIFPMEMSMRTHHVTWQDKTLIEHSCGNVILVIDLLLWGNTPKEPKLKPLLTKGAPWAGETGCTPSFQSCNECTLRYFLDARFTGFSIP
jgi:hypothetical protein